MIERTDEYFCWSIGGFIEYGSYDAITLFRVGRFKVYERVGAARRLFGVTWCWL